MNTLNTSRFGSIRARIDARLIQARREGVVSNVKRIASIICVAFVWLALLPVTAVLHLVGYRRLTVLGSRIGHLAAEMDCFLKQQAMGELSGELHYFLAIPADRVANRHLLNYWKELIPVISHPVLARLLEAMSWKWLMRTDVSAYVLRIDDSADCYRISSKWSGRAPLLSLNQNDRTWGHDQLSELGIPEGAWFVCVHVREAGFSPSDEASHAHRNGHIDALLPAMRMIAAQGGWCVRVGDPTMSPLPACSNTVDYAHHHLRSERLDIILCASCRFFLGNTSGLFFVSSTFGAPSALANMIPFSTLGYLPNDLSIPKLLRDKSSGQYLGFAEILDSPVANFRYAKQYENAGLGIEESSPEDIAAMAEEMLNRLDNTFIDTDEDMTFKNSVRSMLRPGHYSYGTPARVAATFLRRHRSLIKSSVEN